jgi:hypothetical protein
MKVMVKEIDDQSPESCDIVDADIEDIEILWLTAHEVLVERNGQWHSVIKVIPVGHVGGPLITLDNGIELF